MTQATQAIQDLNIRELIQTREDTQFRFLKNEIYKYLMHSDWWSANATINIKVQERLKKFFIEKGFYVQDPNGTSYTYLKISVEKSFPSFYRMEPEELMYLVYRRYKNYPNLEKELFRIIESYIR
jgi:hypothetical protein